MIFILNLLTKFIILHKLLLIYGFIYNNGYWCVMKKRNQIEDKYKWKLEDIYSSDEELLVDIEKLKSYPTKLSSYKGKLKNVSKCLEFFKLSTQISYESEKIGVYIGLRLAENMENSKYLELSSVVSELEKNITIASAFEESELLK